MNNSSTSSRIAKNTFFLYLRSLLVLIITLYTSRVILKTLGIVDYGIYNVVGGVVEMLAFLKVSMSNTFQRYYNYSLGKGDNTGVRDVFQSALFVQIVFALLIFFVAETIGLWFVKNRLVISEARMTAALWIYQISIFSFVLAIIQVPFTSMVIAYEKMNHFAFISIFDAFLKLLFVCILQYINYDKLIFYASLLSLIPLIDMCFYVVICKRNFNTCIIQLNTDKSHFKSLFSFGGWGIIGSLAYTLKSQGINIILNLFFGPVVNAARGIAYQILHAVNMFVESFQTSFRPQLTKSYAQGDFRYMKKLYFSSTKISFFLLWFLSLPLIIETPMILRMWLGDNIPDYTVSFVRLVLFTALVSAYANPTSCLAYATGKIKKFTTYVSGINLMILPVSYVFLLLGGKPTCAMIVSLVFTVFVQIVRMFLLRSMIPISILEYSKHVVVPTFIMMIISSIGPIIFDLWYQNSFIATLINCIISVFSVSFISWIFLFDQSEKTILLAKIKSVIHKK